VTHLNSKLSTCCCTSRLRWQMFCALDSDGSGLIDHAELVQGVSCTNSHELPRTRTRRTRPLTSAPGCASCAPKLRYTPHPHTQSKIVLMVAMCVLKCLCFCACVCVRARAHMNVCARGDGSFLIGGSRLEMRRVETCLPPATQEAKSASKNFGK
jgi:hypothetical protein